MKRGRLSMKVRTGITLIELAIVLVIIGLMTSAVIISLKRPYQRIRLADTIEKVEQLQRMSRQLAVRQSEPMLIEFDFDRQVISRSWERDADSENAKEHSSARITLSSGIRMSQLRIADQQMSSGTAVVEINQNGVSNSFAMKLQSNHESVWLLFAGGSGQLTQLKNTEEVDHVFEIIAS